MLVTLTGVKHGTNIVMNTDDRIYSVMLAPYIMGVGEKFRTSNKAFRHVDTLYKNLFTIYIVKEIF